MRLYIKSSHPNCHSERSEESRFSYGMYHSSEKRDPSVNLSGLTALTDSLRMTLPTNSPGN
jgi:hypothetical protein